MAVNSEQRNRNQRRSGIPFLAIGVPLIIAGLVVVAIVEGGLGDGVGATIAGFGGLSTIVGSALIVIAWVESRAREGKPFA